MSDPRMSAFMLWFDDEKGRIPEGKIHLAASHYESKYGTRPTVCYVPSSVLLKPDWAGLREVEGIRVEGRPFVLPGHFHIGVPDDEE